MDSAHGTPWSRGLPRYAIGAILEKQEELREKLFFNGQEFTSMPTYDYKCTKCGHTFEAFQSKNDRPLSRCPVCKGALRRLIGGGMGVIFKGSGFYTTDYKKSSTLAGFNGGKESAGKRKNPGEKISSEKSSSDRSSSDRSSSDRKARPKELL